MKAILVSLMFFSMMIISCGANTEPERQPTPAPGKYSTGFNQPMEAALNEYYALSEAFVRWDSLAAETHARTFEEKLALVPLAEIKDARHLDSARAQLEKIRPLAASIAGAKDITAKRRSFDQMTETFYDFLQTVEYDQKTIYLQECPMAFEDGDVHGVWLTDKGKDSIRNPYLGLYHWKYKSSMLVCGDNKSTIDFQKK